MRRDNKYSIFSLIRCLTRGISEPQDFISPIFLSGQNTQSVLSGFVFTKHDNKDVTINPKVQEVIKIIIHILFTQNLRGFLLNSTLTLDYIH